MSENTKPTPQNDEVDLGQIFVYIEKVFKKIGQLIYRIFELLLLIFQKVIVLLSMILLIVKQHFVKVILAGVIGFGAAYFLDKKSKPEYEAYMLVKQNFGTGEVLSSNISRYNDLSESLDSINLSKELNITPKSASNLVGFSLKGLLNRNTLLQEYSKHIKDIDSINRPDFDTYIDNLDSGRARVQQIFVRSLDKEIFDLLSKPILDAVKDNPYFILEKEKEIKSLNTEINTLKLVIVKSDTLQSSYFKLLDKYYSTKEGLSPSGTLNLNLANTKDKINTREFDLFQEQLRNRQKLDELQSRLLEKQNIIELQKGFNSPVIIESKYKKMKTSLPLILAAIVILFYLFKELNIGNLIKEYGSKDKLYE